MTDLFELIEVADKKLKINENVDTEIVEKIKDIVLNNRYYGIAQINTISGDLQTNAQKIAKYIKFADKIGLEAIVFPELALTGCSLEYVIQRYPTLVEDNLKWLKGLANATKHTIAYVGFIEPDDSVYYSSIAVLHNGSIQKIIRKSVYSPNKADSVISIKTDNIYNNSLIMSNVDVEIDNTMSANLLINCSNLSFNENRHLINNVLSHLSAKTSIPLINVNIVGANDNILFDGISSVYNSKGEIIARASAFEEQFMVVNPFDNIGKVYPLPSGYDDVIEEKTNFSLNYEYDLERIYKALICGVKDYFTKCGLKRAVLGLSGGLDSTVCAVLLADALGKDNVLGVSMPSHITSSESKSDAEQLANNLGIHFVEAPIRDMIDTTTDSFNKLFNKVELEWNDRYIKSFTPDNIQARSRAMILYGISNEFPSCIPIATSDKSEAYMGYATINGDMSGGFAPIADITKTKLFALARWLNKNRQEKNAIPESVINKRPGAELAIDPKTGKPLKAEDALMPYEFLDEIIWRIENYHQTYQEMLKSQFLYEKQNSISKEQKIEWLDKFYNRMSKAFYKWSIMPPSVMVEPYSINSIDYKQLITSCGINYKGVSQEYISENLALS